MAAVKVNPRDLSQWGKTGKKSYEIWACRPPLGTKVHNVLRKEDYVTNQSQPFVLSGTCGEQWIASGSELAAGFTFANGEPINEQSVGRRCKGDLMDWVKIKSIPGQICNFALKLPSLQAEFRNFPVTTSRGEVMHANVPGIPHGDGDYLVCSMTPNGMPNLQDVWVVNGKVFPSTYSLQYLHVSDKAKAAANQSVPQPDSLIKEKVDDVETALKKQLTDSIDAAWAQLKREAANSHRNVAGIDMQYEVKGSKIEVFRGQPRKSSTYSAAELAAEKNACVPNNWNGKGQNATLVVFDIKFKTLYKGMGVRDTHIVWYYWLDMDELDRLMGVCLNVKGTNGRYVSNSPGSIERAVMSMLVSELEIGCERSKFSLEALVADIREASATAVKEGLASEVRVKLTNVVPTGASVSGMTSDNVRNRMLQHTSEIGKISETGLFVEYDYEGKKTVHKLWLVSIKSYGRSELILIDGMWNAFTLERSRIDDGKNTAISNLGIAITLGQLKTDEVRNETKKNIIKLSGNFLGRALVSSLAMSFLDKVKNVKEQADELGRHVTGAVEGSLTTFVSTLNNIAFTKDGNDKDSWEYREQCKNMTASKLEDEALVGLLGGLARSIGLLKKMKELGSSSDDGVVFITAAAILAGYHSKLFKAANKHGLDRATSEMRDEWYRILLVSYGKAAFTVSYSYEFSIGTGEIAYNGKIVDVKDIFPDAWLTEAGNVIAKINDTKLADGTVSIEEKKQICAKVVESELGRYMKEEFNRFMSSVVHDVKSVFISEGACTISSWVESLDRLLNYHQLGDIDMTNVTSDRASGGKRYIGRVNKSLDYSGDYDRTTAKTWNRLELTVNSDKAIVEATGLVEPAVFAFDSLGKVEIAPYRIVMTLCKKLGVTPAQLLIKSTSFWGEIARQIKGRTGYEVKVGRPEKLGTSWEIPCRLMKDDSGNVEKLVVRVETDVKTIRDFADVRLSSLTKSERSLKYSSIAHEIENDMMQMYTIGLGVGHENSIGMNMQKGVLFTEVFITMLIEEIMSLINGQ